MSASDWVMCIGLLAAGTAGAHYMLYGPWSILPRSSKPKCAHEYCSGKADPRCAGGNCTSHCATILGCYGACIRVWEKSGKALEISQSILEKARK